VAALDAYLDRREKRSPEMCLTMRRFFWPARTSFWPASKNDCVGGMVYQNRRRFFETARFSKRLSVSRESRSSARTQTEAEHHSFNAHTEQRVSARSAEPHRAISRLSSETLTTEGCPSVWNNRAMPSS